ncbi:hypothetical protein BC826DRAFT_1050299 [Russula brevipes]|nr:hypothetical protein BC826DRAFT_1050299 [Russula brevipes]
MAQKSPRRVLKRRKYFIQSRAKPNSSRASSFANPSSQAKPRSAQSCTQQGRVRRSDFKTLRSQGKAHHRSISHSPLPSPPLHFIFCSAADFYGFFFRAIPEEHGNVLTLRELHELVSDVWLSRHDAELEEERTTRRKGRPKSTKEQKLEEVKLREAEGYRAGIEIPDLTHPENIALYRTWDQREVVFVQLLRFIRISSTYPDTAILKHNSSSNLSYL